MLMKSSVHFKGKRNRSLCISFIIFIFSFLQLHGQLNGTYTIGGASPDYADFTSAVTDLVSQGVDGDVTFNVADGTYTEQVSIPLISGTESLFNSITFKSASEDSTKVILTYASSDVNSNYTLQLDGTKNIYFEKITIEATGTQYTRAIDMRGSMDMNTIRNCRVISPTSTPGGTDDNAVIYYTGSNGENWIYNSVIKNGYYGIYSKGQSGTINNINIVNNSIEDQIKTCVRLDSNDYSKVSQNTIKIFEDQYTSGVYLYGCTEIEVSGNKIFAEGTGISTNNTIEDAFYKINIYNNFLSCASSAMSFNNNNNASIFVRYNNAHVYEKYEYAKTVTITGSASGNFTFTNNVLTNNAKEHVMYIETGSVTYSGDYNDFYTNGGFLAYYNFQPIADLAAFQSATGEDAHSISVDPFYVSGKDLHVSNPELDSAATTISGIITDIDGEDRDDSYPDIGADEFDVPADDVGVTEIIHNISTGCTEVQVVVTNFGSSGVSNIPVDVLIKTPGGDETLNGTITETLAQLEKDTLSIGNVTDTDEGDYTFKAYTSLTGDGKINNDTSNIAITKENAEDIPVEERFTSFTGTENWITGEGFERNSTEETLYLGMVNPLKKTSCIYENAVGPVTSTSHLLLKFKAVDVASLDPSINININLYECENKLTTLHTINSSNYTPDAYIDLDFNIDEYEGMYVRPQIEVTKNTGVWLHAHFDDMIIANAPVVDLGADKQACNGSTITLRAGESPSNTYSWHELSDPGTELGTTDTLVVDQPGDYVAIVTEPFYNLSNSDTVNVSFGDNPTANDQTPEICDNEATGIDLTELNDEITAGTGETVTWYNDAGLTEEVPDPTNVTVTDGQEFYAKVGDGTCTATAVVTYTVKESPVQLVQVNSIPKGFTMYPNPVSDVVNVRVSETSDVTIYNQTGEKKVNVQIDEQIMINCSGMAPGIYIVVVNNNTGSFIKKLVVQ